MEIRFLGVGEACDGNQSNTSILLKTDSMEACGRILLDCGFNVPHHYFSLNPPPDELDVLWISHFHGDHFFGVPQLLLWFWEMDRMKPLTIMGPPGVKNTIEATLKLAYPNLLARLAYSLKYKEISPGEELQVSDCTWQAASNEHSQQCFSVRLDIKDRSIFYSGDGRPTPLTQSLAKGCDIIIHEAYGIEDSVPGHGSIMNSLEFARRAGAKILALVHIQRDIRLQFLDEVSRFQQDYSDFQVIVPESGSTITI
jgi:ribonuclease BN (tRNA processing enzyme)